MLEWTVDLDVTRGGFKANGALVEATVDTDVPKFPALETSLIAVGVITGKGCIVIASGPLNFSVNDGDLFFLDQRG